jgi:hypothetical protein
MLRSDIADDAVGNPKEEPRMPAPKNMVHVDAEHLIAAPAADVYRIIADYHDHHPAILPAAITNLTVQKGGVGAGTVVGFDVRLGGTRMHSIAEIAEPEPGRVLTETDLRTGAVTTFEVMPDGEFSLVRIRTVFPASRGLCGWIERRFAPGMLRKMYVEELTNLDRYARQQAGAVGALQGAVAHS